MRKPAWKLLMDTHRYSLALSSLAWLALASAPACATEPSQDTQRALVAMTQSLMDALATGKSDVWQRALADDAVIVDEFGRIQDKAEAVKSVTGLPAGLSGEIKLLNPQVRVHGDTAVLVVDDDEHETVFGQQLHVLYRMMATYVRRDGAWKLLAMQDVTVPTTPPALDVPGLKLADYPGVYRYGPDRAFTVDMDGQGLGYTTRAGRSPTRLLPLARDAFMDDGDEKNLYLFRRDAQGRVVAMIERRKFNDLVMTRDEASP